MVEPGVINLDVTRAAAPYGLYYRARSVEPVRLHDRRQHRVQLRRRALPQVRHDLQPRPRHQGRAARRRGRHARRARAWRRSGPTWSACSSGSEGLFGVALEITLRLLPRPELFRTVLAAYHSLEAAGRSGGAGRRVRPAARRDGDHGPAGDRGGRGRGPRRLSARRGRAADRRAGRRGRARSSASSSTCCRSSRRRARTRCGWRRTKRTGCASGRGARAPSPRSAGSARTTSSTTASSRAAGWARRLRQIEALSRALRHPGGQCVSCRRRQPAPADPVQRPRAGRARAGRGAGGRDPGYVHRLRRLDHRRARHRGGEARLPAAHVRRGTTSRRCAGCAGPSTRSEISNPGKMFPGGDAASLSHAGPHPLERAGVISRE